MALALALGALTLGALLYELRVAYRREMAKTDALLKLTLCLWRDDP